MEPTDGDQETQETPEAQEPTTPAEAIPVDELPDELREIPREDLSRTLRAMVRATTDGAQRIRDLERELEDSRRRATPAHAREPEPEPEEPVDLKELILDDPEKAIMTVARKAGLFDRLQGMESTSSDVAMMRAERELPEFDSFRETVEQIMESTGAPRTFRHVSGAYYMARGLADVARVSKKAASRTAPEKPRPTLVEDEKPKVSSLLRDVAANMGVSEDEIEKYMSDEPFQMEVPGVGS